MTRPMSEDEQAVWAAMRSVYAGFLAGDPGAVDAVLHPDVTIWDSDEPEMAHGLGELAALRGRRGPSEPSGPSEPFQPSVVALDARDPVIDVWDDTALLRHVLVVRLADGSEQVVRNTSTWRRIGGTWLAVHNHEDVIGGV